MKNLTCSWRDHAALRQFTEVTPKGNGTIYKAKKCLNKRVFHDVRLVNDVEDIAKEFGSGYPDFEHFQPSHAKEIGQHFRKREKEWSEATRKEVFTWIERCEEEHLTVAQLRQLLRQQELTALPSDTPELPATTYRCIVADPPWPMKKSERAPRPDQGAHLAYRTMSLEAIESLGVEPLAYPQGCHLYLWVTHRFLPDGLRILAAWGFTYHCLLTWIKPTGMTPFSWMLNTEHALFGYRGKFKAGAMGQKVSFEAPAPRGEHSTKPEVFFERVRSFSHGPRLEMFARNTHEGFDGWGNELPE